MNCEFAEKVSALIDGELAFDEAQAVERHLSKCHSCQEMRADFYSLGREIERFPLRTPPRSQQKPSFTGVIAKWRPALFAVTTALFLIVFGLVLRNLFRNQQHNRNTEFTTQNQSRPGSSKSSPSPTPSASPEPVSKPKSETRDDEESPQTPPKFRLREAITKRVKSPVERTADIAVASDLAPKTSDSLNSLHTARVSSADTETLTAQHVEQSELLLRSFRNLPVTNAPVAELSHERQRAQQLFYQNVMLRREADSAGDVQVATLLQSLEPILLDIANLPNDAQHSDVKEIKDRVERQNLVALLQINTKAPMRK
ncbi:MAG TPA: zf-HC2 domain-containing protein [Pyrinomonadaceae bacterium]|jgi:hypothetical protein|nr:zf-HC2 domain-containing protein [Pyrinomonadaceae bacterium]